MARILHKLSVFWSALAKTLRQVSLRFAVLVVGLYFFLIPPQENSISLTLDSALLSIAGYFLDDADEYSVAVVNIPQSEIETWQRDTYVASTFSAVLSNILESRNTHVGLILREPINTFPTAVDGEAGEDPFSSANERDVYLKHKRYLSDLLQDRRVILGLNSRFADGVPALAELESYGLMPIVERALSLFPRCENCVEQRLSRKPQVYYFVPEQSTAHTPLLVNYRNSAYPNLYFAMLATSLGRNPLADEMYWSDNQGLAVGDTLLMAGDNFVAAPKISSSGRIPVLAFDEALVAKSFPRFVVLASDQDEAMAVAFARNLHALQGGQHFYTPWWYGLAQQLLFLVLTLLLVWGLALVSSGRWYWSLVAASSCLLVMTCFVALLAARWWLPVGNLFVFCLVSACLVSFWQINQIREKRASLHLNRNVQSAVNRLETSGYYRDAIELLAVLERKPRTRERMFRLIDRMVEEGANIDEAIDVLDTLREHDNSTSIEHKLQELKQIAAGLTADTLASTQSRGEELVDAPSTLGRYEVQKELGRGAVGVVYLGFDPAISRQVAIKTLNYRQFSAEQTENLKARFFREAEAAGRLSHPNIVSIYDVGEQGELAYIAMDYVDGEALSQRAHEDRLLPVSEVYRIILDVAMALDYAHSHQVIHRDIKPSNILYASSPYQLKVADFGIARLLDNSRTTTGEILGSPLYMAPEQLKGSKVDVTADVFSLGVTFYQLLCGHLPFNADNLAGLTYEIIHNKHKSVRQYRKDLPASAIRIVNQCLQKDPIDRYESAFELANVLKKAIRRDFPAEAREFGLA